MVERAPVAADLSASIHARNACPPAKQGDEMSVQVLAWYRPCTIREEEVNLLSGFDVERSRLYGTYSLPRQYCFSDDRVNRFGKCSSGLVNRNVEHPALCTWLPYRCFFTYTANS